MILDLHNHTRWSFDCSMDPAKVVRLAKTDNNGHFRVEVAADLRKTWRLLWMAVFAAAPGHGPGWQLLPCSQD